MSDKSDTKQKDGKRDGREWLLLLLSVLLAFIVWLLHNLSSEYSVFLEYGVNAEISEVGLAQKSVSNDLLMIRGKAEGYYILKHRFGKRKYIDVQIPEGKLHVKDSIANLYQINCEDIRSGIVERLSGNVELEFIVTSTLDFNIRKMSNKRVPIVPKTSISFAEQYMPVGRMELMPDSINIYGETKLLSTIDSVWTKNIIYNGADAALQGIAEIVPIRWISYSQDAVYYTQEVTRYIEESMTVPVRATGVPVGKDLIILPSVIQVTCRRIFSAKKIDEKDFKFVVRYEDFLKSIDSKVIPTPVSVPEDIISYSIHPRFVDCIYIDNM